VFLNLGFSGSCYLDFFDKYSPFKEKLLGDLEEDKPCLKGFKSAKRMREEEPKG